MINTFRTAMMSFSLYMCFIFIPNVHIKMPPENNFLFTITKETRRTLYLKCLYGFNYTLI